MVEANQHFAETIGGVPDSVALLRTLDPAFFDAYAAARAHLYRPPPEGHLEIAAKELVFIVVDTVVGHVEGAKAHAAAGLAAGLTPEQIMEALGIAVLIAGHNIWAKAGAEVMRHVLALVEAKPSA